MQENVGTTARKSFSRFTLIALLSLLAAGALLATAAASAAPGKPVAFLSGPNSGDPLSIARRYLEQNKASLGLSSRDIAGALITDQYASRHNGVTHIYMRQQYQGIEVHGANISINIAADGSVINLSSRFVPDVGTAINTTVPFLRRGEAISAAARSLGKDPARGPVSRNPIQPRLVFQPVGKGIVRLAWELEIYELDASNWWTMRIDAINGTVLDQKNYVARDSYRVYALPVESPSHGSSSIVDSTGAWLTGQCTDGNNVDAYLDTDNSNAPTGGDAARACDAGLNFLFTPDFLQEPGQYQDAAVTNLFYWNNVIHDVFYLYGFDEVAGNFQDDNGANGGMGGDSVRAEAQDGGGVNNANFATPPDGSRPRMQMYLWNHTTPQRDGDFDNGIIIHEYGHGISNRLTGGPSTTSCLGNTEQAGEGWSDYFALLMTIEEGDTGTDTRGIGTYALGEPTNGTGIRDYPYSTDMGIDPRTYDDIKTASVPHGVGSTWAAMLWEMTWALMADHAFDPDLYSGTGGNNLALQLVVDGLKLQPCSPGFVDSRDAILLADQINNGGANQCRIWEAFSKRGLGASADQGSASSRSDGVEAYDLPKICQEILAISSTPNPSPVEAGQVLTYTLLTDNRTTGTLTNVTATNAVPAHSSYVANSATCGGSEAGGTVTFPLGAMASGASQSCDFQVTVSSSASVEVLSDDMENGGGLWVASHGAGNDDWALSTADPHSPVTSWFAADISTSTDQYLTLANPVAISGDAVLRFWHRYDTETNWDGGVVEISVNGGAWTDLGDAMVQNGYNSTINNNPASAISDRRAFSGDSSGYVETLVDLSAYSGPANTVQIRFRMATDGFVGGLGWYVDDVQILDDALLTSQACVTAAEGDSDCETVLTLITPVAGSPAPRINVSPSSLASTQFSEETVVSPLTIANTGSAELTWSIAKTSGNNCSAPDGNLPWAAAFPSGGSVAPASNVTVDVSFDSTGLLPDAYSGALCVASNDSDNTPVTVPLTLTVDDPTLVVVQPATGEIPGTGVVTGAYVDTHGDDGIHQQIIEQHQGGKPADRFDALMHTWQFDLQSGTGMTFEANAWAIEPVAEGDEILWSYSTDNANFTWFYTLTSADSGNGIVVPIPDQGSGPFYIRVMDGDRTNGNNSNASLYVDYLAIREGGTPMPPSSIDMKVSGMSDESEPSNRKNRWSAIVRVNVVDVATSTPVEGATVSGTWSNGASGGGSCTTDSSGQCTINKMNIRLNVPTVRFSVNIVTRGPGDTYNEPESVTSIVLTAP